MWRVLFFFSSSCKTAWRKKKKKKMDRQKDLKGIVYLFDSLRILFSYNLSAIKRGVSFFISSISVVCFCYLCEGIVCSIKQIIWLIAAKREYFMHCTSEGNAHSPRQSRLHYSTRLPSNSLPQPRRNFRFNYVAILCVTLAARSADSRTNAAPVSQSLTRPLAMISNRFHKPHLSKIC